ncbi:xanthine dehydrogenase family protein molybdopterin-binding subunit [Algoriphagus pacificus]|uniref:Xanthine dehydrogenase family protein molybdopterin-binding subunit n=1 Tax=Algoriphagus pacificus TaxID=2811234 RepID=A0ABS3CGZ6_9BACT|nr:molybdopterin cofactor-binding domain-containing protein [Algoriphagus pacificus]MBN7815819.1 xanthine dehydrogenase family protein molybdopterin-binding subunit [Algoriphagus pacificus]
MIELPKTSRRKFLKNLGYISVGFPMLGFAFLNQDPEMAARVLYNGNLPGSMRNANQINAWLRVMEDGSVKVFSGKVELGQGIRMAICQVAAEELDMELDQVEVHLAETGLTPDEGYTAGSGSVPNSAMSARYAAAMARKKLLELASKKLNTPESELILYNGLVKTKNGSQSMNFAQLLEGAQLEMEVTKPVPVKVKSGYRYVGKAIPRKDIPKMVRAEEIYIQDLRFPGMLHARVLRPAGYQSKLEKLDDSGLGSAVSGLVKTVVNGSFVGVITVREYEAVKAVDFLKKRSQWSESPDFPRQENMYSHLKEIADPPQQIRNDGNVNEANNGISTYQASYTKPYLQHGSIGPGCGIAMFDGDILHIWSHSQGIYPMRRAISGMLKMDQEKIHVISVPGAGCFGHSTADDAAADAAILAMTLPGKHIRVQWSREDEHTWEPYGSSMILDLKAGLDSQGKIQTWTTDVWTDTHSMRPDSDPATLLDTRYLESPAQLKGRGYLGGGHRNADPYYSIPNMQVNAHFFNGPLRVSSLRSLGSYGTIFSIESFMDELAEKEGKDPIEFRLTHLEDPRAIEVLKKIKETTNSAKLNDGEGIGFAFSRYKNTTAYAAVAVHVAVDTKSGAVKVLKMWAAVDVGEIINMDGIINQLEGGMIQAASWTLKEEVTFEGNKITSEDWDSYPIFRFPEIPEVEVHMINRPEEAAEGGGEVSMPPTGAAIANAVYKASGKRVYDLPITPEKILS